MNLIPLKANLVLTEYLSHENYSSRIIQDEIYIVKNIIDNWDNYDEEKKYRLLSKYYVFKNSINDVLEIINSSLGTEFSKFCDISTKMEIEDVDSRGYGLDFNWYYVYSRVHYLCAVTNDTNIENKNYSKEE